MKKSLMIFFLLFASMTYNVIAGVEVNEFDNKEDEQQFKVLVNELRCLVCQNQNLADSNAELAQDLRKEVYQMIQKGQSNEEIIEFMVSRYGDFVLYRPPFKPVTLILWLGPFFILLFAVIFLIVFIKKKKTSDLTEISDEEKHHAEDLLKSIDNDKRNIK
ncbi:MAG: cytochrome c-type biogenesis protein CcmH [Gammaproteobacteria bacterium]|nr:cytochrome c-type biogenesis protein CcmH [Gammaproteobacteria bacterium]